jgi:hypothetical protein
MCHHAHDLDEQQITLAILAMTSDSATRPSNGLSRRCIRTESPISSSAALERSWDRILLHVIIILHLRLPTPIPLPAFALVPLIIVLTGQPSPYLYICKCGAPPYIPMRSDEARRGQTNIKVSQLRSSSIDG